MIIQKISAPRISAPRSLMMRRRLRIKILKRPQKKKLKKRPKRVIARTPKQMIKSSQK